MKFWDSSAVLPLLLWEQDTVIREGQLREDADFVVWWGTRIECHSALRRRLREGGIGSKDGDRALARLTALAGSWIEVPPSEAVRLRAERLLVGHNLRAADALQLGAALNAFKEQTANQHFLTADARLASAAAAEGFQIR
ncbi:MAG TPA: type II toxin-antitoxin system VapC family toxin [Chthoniobacterales bacterium]|jgi:predicted nucleic acid-binding protein